MNTTLLRCGAASLLLFSSLATAQDAAEVLISQGDVLTNGWTVQNIGEFELADTGDWASIVGTTEPSATGNKVLILNGFIAAAEGSPLLGETVALIGDVSVSPQGDLAFLYTVVNPNGSGDTLSRLRLDGLLIMSEDDVVMIPGLPAGSTVNQIFDVSIDRPVIMISLEVRTPAGTLIRCIASADVSSGLYTTPVLVASVGDVTGGLAGPLEVIFDGFVVDSLGESMINVAFDMGGSQEYAILRNGTSYMETGKPGPFVGSTWAQGTVPDVAQRNGHHAASGQVELSDGSLVGVVTGRFGPVTGENEGTPVGTVASFLYCDVDVMENGQVAYAVPITGGETATFIQRIPVLLSGTSRASGRLITDIPYNSRSVVQVAGDGTLMLTRVTLQGGDDALVRVDRSIGAPSSCTVVPNSTGQTGALTAIGSPDLALDNLTVIASQLPTNSFGYLITSTSSGFVATPGGSTGNICLGGTIGRYLPQVASSGAAGKITTEIDLSAMPQPTTTLQVMPGDSWAFQLWHRDSGMSGPTSNFTDAISVTFN